MTLLDRYIFRSVLFTCAGAVGLFAFLILLVNLMRDLLNYVLLTSSRSLGTVFIRHAGYPRCRWAAVLSACCSRSAVSRPTVKLPRCAPGSLYRARQFWLAGLGVAAALYVNFDAMPHGRVKYEQDLTLTAHESLAIPDLHS